MGITYTLHTYIINFSLLKMITNMRYNSNFECQKDSGLIIYNKYSYVVLTKMKILLGRNAHKTGMLGKTKSIIRYIMFLIQK